MYLYNSVLFVLNVLNSSLATSIELSECSGPPLFSSGTPIYASPCINIWDSTTTDIITFLTFLFSIFNIKFSKNAYIAVCIHIAIQSSVAILNAGSLPFILTITFGVSIIIGINDKIINTMSAFSNFFSCVKYFVI